MIKLTLIRDILGEEFTLGRMYVNGQLLGQTCEDKDRHIEDGEDKVYGTSAIPRGLYKVSLSFSHRFQRVLPEIHDVPKFSGVRIHGGNTAADTLGCVLLGSIRTANGVKNCAGVMGRLISILEDAENSGEDVTLEIVK